MRRPDGLTAILGLTAALVLAAPTVAPAQVSKCQAVLEKETGKLEKDLFLRLNKCVNTIRKEREKGLVGSGPKGSLAKAAAFCEKMLDKTLDVDRNSGGKGKLDKFFSAIDGAHTSGKCDNTPPRKDLDDLGHFVSAENAPGSLPQDFVKHFLGARAIYAAWEKQVLANDQTRTRIQDAIDAPSDSKADGTDCTNGVAPLPNTVWRANLCAFHKDTSTRDNPVPSNQYDPITGTLNPICRLHACQLLPGDGNAGTTNDSEADVVLAASTLVAGLSGTVALSICDMGNLPQPFDLQDYFFIGLTSSNGILKAPLGAVGDVCLRTYRSEGWCDCVPGGSGLLVRDSLLCRDHVVDPNDVGNVLGSDACGGRPEEATEEECVCADQLEIGCGGANKCDPSLPFERCKRDSDCGTPGDVCVARETGGRCHAGTWNGEFVTTLGNPMQEGDCLTFTTSTLTVVPPGEEGPDGVPCTDDDDVAQGGDGKVPLTTGQVSAVLFDAIAITWGATCSEGRVGDNCLEDSNCDTHTHKCVDDPSEGCVDDGDCTTGSCDLTSSGNGFCDTTGSSLGSISAGPKVGQRGSCADYESSDFAGVRLVAAVPFVDGSGLGDGAFAFRFVCR